jgi:hypothetical protein
MRSTALACAALLPGALLAQNQFIVPSVLPGPGGNPTATTTGGGADTQMFWTSTSVVHPVHVQLLWPVSDIPVPAAALTSVSFRRPNSSTATMPSATATIQVDLSVGPNTVAGRSTTFTANQGTVTTVFSGNLNLPLEVPSGPAAAPFNLPIVFTTPFVYVAASGSTLVMDVTTTAYAPISASATWQVDATGTDPGLRVTNRSGSTCRFSNGNTNSGIGHTNPTLGGFWSLNYQGGLPANMPAVGLLGFKGVGSTWNGIPLPVDLTPAGAPGCWLATSIALTAVLTVSGTSANIYNWPRLPVPADPTLYDQSFYDQVCSTTRLPTRWASCSAGAASGPSAAPCPWVPGCIST